ncbi:MAG: spore coat protein [Ruminococcus sp.]|nr:spore coat protein [Candidatus Apopatosoma intestinale]
MNDRDVMENILLLEKGVIDLYLHGTVESSTPNVRGTFDTALSDSLTMQDDVYAKMTAKGWYQTKPAPKTEVDTVKQKFTVS